MQTAKLQLLENV